MDVRLPQSLSQIPIPFSIALGALLIAAPIIVNSSKESRSFAIVQGAEPIVLPTSGRLLIHNPTAAPWRVSDDGGKTWAVIEAGQSYAMQP